MKKFVLVVLSAFLLISVNAQHSFSTINVSNLGISSFVDTAKSTSPVQSNLQNAHEASSGFFDDDTWLTAELNIPSGFMFCDSRLRPIRILPENAANHPTTSRTDSMWVKDFEQLEWHPKKTLPAGAQSAVAFGDPTKGHYDFYGKFPANYTVPAHRHSSDCSVVIIKGSMTIKRAGAADRTMKEGSFFTLPGKMTYTAYTPQECIFLVHGEKPFDIFYVNPKDDPRNQ